MKILFDIDGVLADFVLAWTTEAVALNFLSAPIKTVDQRSWDLAQLGLTPEQVKAVWHFTQATPWWWLEKLRSLITRDQFFDIDKISTINETYFVTNRHGGIPNVQLQTQRWLKEQGVRNPNVISANKKAGVAKAIGITHSIEDKLENAVRMPGDSYLMDRPYNRIDRPSTLKVISNIQEFLEAIKHERV